MRFIDCPQCGKRVRSDAATCHRCGASLDWQSLAPEDDDFESEHHAEGGYSQDALDERETDEEWAEQNSTGRRLHPVWYFTGWLLVIAFLLPVLLQLFAILRP